MFFNFSFKKRKWKQKRKQEKKERKRAIPLNIKIVESKTFITLLCFSQTKYLLFSEFSINFVLVLSCVFALWWLNNFKSVRKVKPKILCWEFFFCVYIQRLNKWEFNSNHWDPWLWYFVKEHTKCEIVEIKKIENIYAARWSNARVYIHLKRIKLKAFITFFILYINLFILSGEKINLNASQLQFMLCRYQMRIFITTDFA
jgi:hypothetical protein